jgi:recombination protein RecA
MVDPKETDKVITAIRKKYGDSVIHKGSDKPDIIRIPTGSLVMDWVTGGGFPLGRWCHFYGGYASAKTLTAWHLIREAQKMGLTCAYYNIENQFDKKWAKERGIDVDALHLIEGTKIEDVGEIMEALLGVVNVHVVDSIGAAVSQDEIAADIRDWQMGLSARAWGKALRRANDRFDDETNMIVLVNHAKDIFGRMGGEEPSGPKLINFYSSLNMHFKRSSWLYYNKAGILSQDGEKTDSLSGDTQPDGMEFQVRIAKSRVGEPLRVARFRMDFQTGEFDHLWVMAKAADYFGVVKKSGSWYDLGNNKKVQGENGLREAIKDDENLRNAITQKVMEDI